ncbi:uncharacterized protein LOC123553863 [Mercenaria mercenaria]|uniref:uncharacterized protein LOC123553863 n=1 Tax=Mercenaria mercenaria TaxID=6596 RepID=UPI001E1D7D41|nr:uncharacterized protein LOC123553863 [Mercenaria mercenaria]
MKHDVVTFKSTAHSILHSFYNRNGKQNSESEQKAIILTAAKLIFSDIKSGEYSKEIYPTASEIMSLESNLKYVPESLQIFLNKIIDNKQGEKKIASIGQAIVQAACPRSVIAPLQIGLGVQVHHLVGSKMLLESLHSLGFCSSYQEVLKYESCAAVTQGTTIHTTNNEFVQYIADNVDHNICTLDGLNTFHGMGIIAAVTPRLKTNQIIPRVHVANEEVTDIAKIDIHFYKQKSNKMEEMIFKHLIDLADIEEPLRELDFLIKIARPLGVQSPGWFGFMHMVHHGKYPGESSLVFMPMIDMSASDLSCIFSTLHFVVSQSNQSNTTPVLTFDQPLYWKALNIIENEPSESKIKSVVVRLGGFHTEMSFLGCIGRIMENTGLKELLATAYAENTVGHMLDGKAINRAIRGHFLVDDALNVLLLEKLLAQKDQSSDSNNNSIQTKDDTNDNIEPETGSDSLKEEDTEQCDIHEVEHTEQNDIRKVEERGQSDINKEKSTEHSDIPKVEDIHHDILNKRRAPESLQNNKTILELMESYEQMKLDLLKYKTARLWLQHMEMIDILKSFIKAERTGNWCLHLKSMQKMLPFFAAAGHNLYLKSAYLYLQQMISLPDSNPQLHNAFCNGFHVVRRGDRYWGGLSTDLAIEQVLMRSVKSVGGLTRGRGMTEAQRAHWLLSVPAMAEINNAMQEFTEHRLITSEQHKESTESRIKRDELDRNTFIDFLKERNPFAEEVELRNIETGVIADKNVNADTAKEVGEGIIKGMTDQKVIEYTFKRKNEAVTLGKKNSVKVDGAEIHVDSQLLFERLIAVADITLDEKEDIFQYELCGNPSSLFDSAGLLREPQKPLLAKAIWDHSKCGTDIISDETVHYVLDGGSLIQRIPWSCGSSFDSICSRYTDYVERSYGKAHVVFDGYCNGPSTKDVTHERRTRGSLEQK